MVHDQNLPSSTSFDLRIDVDGPEQTRELARRAASLLQGGEVILLYGPLGAGKTCFTQGLCDALGVTDEVVSPTFTLVNSYLGGRLPVHHLDFYRVEPHHDLDDIGLPDILDEVYEGRAVTLIEWPEPAIAALDPHEPRLELLAVPREGLGTRTWHLRGTPEILPPWADLFNNFPASGGGL